MLLVVRKFKSILQSVFLVIVCTFYCNEVHSKDIIMIKNNGGGIVNDYFKKTKQYKKNKVSIQFHGYCNSACTIFLSLNKNRIFYHTNASFGFHKPYGGSENSDQIAQDRMMKLYPGWVRKWLKSQGGLKKQMIYLDRETISRHMKRCPSSRTDPVTAFRPL